MVLSANEKDTFINGVMSRLGFSPVFRDSYHIHYSCNGVRVITNTLDNWFNISADVLHLPIPMTFVSGKYLLFGNGGLKIDDILKKHNIVSSIVSNCRPPRTIKQRFLAFKKWLRG